MIGNRQRTFYINNISIRKLFLLLIINWFVKYDNSFSSEKYNIFEMIEAFLGLIS